MIKIIGLTGRMCSGKTTIANFLKNLGCVVLSADFFAKEVLKNSGIILQLSNAFGKEIIENGKIIPAKLSKKAFASKENQQKLGSITHPLISEKFLKSVEKIKAKKEKKIIIYDAPLLLETNAYKKVEKIILVITPLEIIYQRWQEKILKKDNQLKEEDLKKRIIYQITPEEAKKKADFLIDGSLSLEAVKKQVQKIYHKIK